MPNPQDVLPLPPRPGLERYKKLAKELLKACKSGDGDAVSEWTTQWIDALARLSGGKKLQHQRTRDANRTEAFIREKLSANSTLTDAQFVMARLHGFESWPRFGRHLEALMRKDSQTARFEAAADAIVSGKAAILKKLLKEDADLIRARSMREHAATLLHYVAANGVENYRQRTPKNIVRITQMLLDAGAAIDAAANVYGGGATALRLAATSIHPERAGVQESLLQLLIDRGAVIDQPRGAGNNDTAVLGCLANGRARAAAYLADHGALLTLESAAGLGRLDAVRSYFDQEGKLKPAATRKQLESGFLYACRYGHTKVVEFLLEKGVDPASHGSDDQTGLHCAVIGGHLDTINVLLQHNPQLERKNTYGGTVLGQALWSAAHGGDSEQYVAIIKALIAAGTEVPARHVQVNTDIDAWLARHGSQAEPNWVWSEEERPRDIVPRKARAPQARK
jgi:hypothetical protein